MKFFDKNLEEKIGYDFVVKNLSILSPYGRSIINNLTPLNDEMLRKELNALDSVVNAMNIDSDVFDKICDVLKKLHDIRVTFKRCENREVLDEVELYEIKNFAMLIDDLRLLYNSIDIQIDIINIPTLEELIAILDPQNKRVNTFYIYNEYSNRLDSIRREKRELENEIFKEKDTERTKELKEKRIKAVIQEKNEELKIKVYLSRELNKHTKILNDAALMAGKLDFLIAKGKIATHFNMCKPSICTEIKIVMINGINPKIKDILEGKNKNFKPISIELEKGASVITGANMGGKSVTLSIVALNLYLARQGFYVFAEKFRFPMVDFIYYVSGDMQCVSEGLSSFGAEIMKLKEAIFFAQKGTGFIIFDEFARGTNPSEGSYITKALLKFLNKLDSISVVTTHFDGIFQEICHYQVIGLKNADFKKIKKCINVNGKNSVEIIQDNMDYRLQRVFNEVDVPKDALNICELLGLNNEIVCYAKELYRNGGKA